MENAARNNPIVNMPEGGVPVAIDANLFVYLEKLANPRFDPNNEVKNAMATSSLHPANYANKRRKELPPLLQDKYLGIIDVIEKSDGKTIKMYSKLLDIFHIYQLIMGGKIHPYLTPTAYREVKYVYANSYMRKFCTVVTVPNEKFDDYKEKRNDLAKEYVDQGAMKGRWVAYEDKYLPDNDAVIMAESAIFGLILITANIKDFIDNVRLEGEYDRADLIRDINFTMGYIFKDNSGNNTSSQPFSPASFYSRLKNWLRGRKDKDKTIWLQSDSEFLQV